VRFEQPINVCLDPRCPWRDLPEAEHFDRHNKRCAELTIGTDGSEVICELL